MPSLSSTLTSTLTLIVTVTSATPQNAFPNAIRGLSDCAQGVLFPLLANSQCNPANFPCICTELDRLGASDAVAAKCSRSDFDQFGEFEINTCGQNIAVLPPPVFNITSVTSTTVTAPLTTGTSNTTTTTTVGPFNNVTTTAGPFNNVTTTAAPTTAAPTTVVIPTTDANGQPSSLTTEVAPTGPSEPSFTGAAAAVEVSGFGKGRMGVFAGVVGLMGLMFAEL